MSIEIKQLREFEGYSTLYYYAKGDHDPIEFALEVSAMDPELEVDTKYIKKEWWRWIPVGEKGMGVIQSKAFEGERGAFLVTCYDIQAPYYEANFKIQPPPTPGAI